MDASEVLAELRKTRQRPEASFKQGAMQGGAEGLLGNALGVPELIARAGRGANNLMRAGMGHEMVPIPPEGLLGLPSGREAAAGIDTALGKMGGLLGTSPTYEENLSRRNQVQSDAPVGQAVGSIAPDLAMVAAGRAPFVKGPGGVFDKGISNLIDEGVSHLGKSAKSTGMAKFTKDIVDSELFRDLARGMGRAGETGIEGMALAAIQGGNPAEAAAMSAGTQMAGSFVNSALDETFELLPKMSGGVIKPPKGLMAKAGILGMYGLFTGNVINLLQQFSPGENDSMMATDAGFSKLAGLMMLGATVGLTGRRSVPDGALSAFPKFADFVNTVPRTVMTSLMSDLSKDESGMSQKALDAIQRAPDAFSEAQMDKLLKGFESGTFSQQVEELSADEKFRAILDAPDPRLAGVPKDDD